MARGDDWLLHPQRAQLPGQPAADRACHVPHADHDTDEARWGQAKHQRQTKRCNQKLSDDKERHAGQKPQHADALIREEERRRNQHRESKHRRDESQADQTWRGQSALKPRQKGELERCEEQHEQRGQADKPSGGNRPADEHSIGSVLCPQC